MDVFAGALDRAASALDEAQAVADATGHDATPCRGLALAAWRGHEATVTALAEIGLGDPLAGGDGLGRPRARWATAVLYNGLGRYEDALVAARAAGDHQGETVMDSWALVELIEAAARSGQPGLGAEALRRLAEGTQSSGTDWALGIEARSRALLSDGTAAEALYREAIERLGRTRIRTELGRGHLVYGEWLRRERRRRDAREQLRTAHAMLTDMGAGAFAERARRELAATGATARKRTAETRGELTPQEAQVAGLARDGLSNPDIAARLFISPRTVEYHLRKVFAKLDISSRRALGHALSGEPSSLQPA
jgi:DNA-binding CsgD family transcriptional regulator